MQNPPSSWDQLPYGRHPKVLFIQVRAGPEGVLETANDKAGISALRRAFEEWTRPGSKSAALLAPGGGLGGGGWAARLI